MKHRIELLSVFRDVRRIWYPGVYRIPEDMSDDLAQDLLLNELAIKVGPRIEKKVIQVDPSPAPGLQSRESGQGKPSQSSLAGRRSPASRSSTSKAKRERP